MFKPLLQYAFHFLTCAFVFLIFSDTAIPAIPPSSTPHILMINSYHQRMPWVKDIVQGVEDTLLPEKNGYSLHIENMDSKEFHSPSYFAVFREYLAVKYQNTEINLILTSDNNAYDFIRENRDHLFPGVQTVFCGVNNFDESQIAGMTAITGAIEIFSAEETIIHAINLIPGLERIYIINDYLKTGRLWEADIQKQVQNLEQKITLEYAENFSLQEMLLYVGSLPPNTALLLGAYFADKTGQFYEYEHVADLLSKSSSVPVFCLIEFVIDEGLIGGQVISGYYQGQSMGQMALQLLQGKDISELPVVKKGSNKAIFNYQQLERFGLNEKSVPANALIVNHPFSFYDEYRQQIWMVVTFIGILLLAIILLLANVQKRKNAEQALRRSENRLRQLAEATWEALVIHDEGIVLEANEIFTKLIGYQVNEIRGRQIVPILFPKRYQSLVKEKIERDNLDKYEAVAHNKDGREFPIEVRVRAMEYDGREVRVAALRDLTERKQMEEELAQSRKMEAIGTLAGGIAHDFNNILSAIIGYAEILLLKRERDQDEHSKLQHILHAGNRAKLLVQQILTFARKVEKKDEQICLSEVVQEVIKLLQATLPSSIEIQCRLSSEGCVQGDTTKMHQLVMNLSTNAAKAMPDGGVLDINLFESEPPPGIHERNPDLSADTCLCLIVRDSGKGIAKENIDRIFDPFFTTGEKQKGTGLGLSVALGIVNESGGVITVDSREGAGATFTIYLPKVDCSAMTEKEDLSILPRGTESVMVIDDEENLINIVSETLSNLGYSVHGFQDGQAALETFVLKPNSFDLVITDMNMPRMTGDVVCRKLLACRADLPIIMCTGYSGTMLESDALEIGIRKFLLKPVAMRTLAENVRALLDEQHF